MPIKCKICEREFDKQISNSHLKTHGVTTTEYKVLYGHDSLSSPEYRAERSKQMRGESNPNYGRTHTTETKKTISNKNKGKVAWNKGLLYEPSTNQIEGVRKREEKYKNGELVRAINLPSDETKQKISKSISIYAQDNPEKMSARAHKAIETKKLSGKYLAFFKGKKHSDETKEILSVKSKLASLSKTENSNEIKLHRITESNLTLLSDISKTTLDLKCNICWTEFSYTKQYFNLCKYTTERCPICFPKIQTNRSVAEDEIFQFVKTYAPDAIQSYRQWSGKNEVDIYIPSKKIAIEYNGLYWHSEAVLVHNNKPKDSDNEKRKTLNSLGVRYIGIFEDEWMHNSEIVKSRLKNILGVTEQKIYARKTTLKEISSKMASEFCKSNHIQGTGRSNVRYGLFLDDELVSVMTFSKNNISRKIQEWEINRFCHKIGYSVVGGASKMFQRFIQDINPEKVVSYADSRYSEGKLYQVLGMVKEKETVPNFWYVPRGQIKRIHRFTLRKKPDEPKDIPNNQLRTNQGFDVIWDCGSSKWIWTRPA